MSYGGKSDYLYREKNGVVGKSIQPVDDSEKIRLQEPVRLQPSWEENNLPEEELNFKNMTMEDASLQLVAPPDRYNLVYLTFLLHGVGILMPWNMFISANKYFQEYKLGEEEGYSKNFLLYVGFAAQIPSVLFNYLNIFIKIGGNLTTRIVWSISIEVIVFILTIVLAMTDTNDWAKPFFWITMISVITINMANGIYQNTVFGMAGKLPNKYTGAVVLGSNISGTFVSVVLILTDTFTSNVRMSAIYYFITALFVLLVCFDTYFALPLNRFYRHHELREKKEAQKRNAMNLGGDGKVPYLYVFKKALPQLFNVFFVFFVTLSIFPALHAAIKPNDTHFIYDKEHTDKYFVSITCFLTFNFFAMLGSVLAGFVRWPGPRYLWIPVALRVFYIPFYLLCNYQVENVQRALPVLITNDWTYWITAITMGLTSGYFSSLGMMYAPRTVESQYAATAGMYSAAALITGIFTGILTAFLWPLVIENVGI